VGSNSLVAVLILFFQKIVDIGEVGTALAKGNAATHSTFAG
jgi:hypothetical protein